MIIFTRMFDMKALPTEVKSVEMQKFHVLKWKTTPMMPRILKCGRMEAYDLLLMCWRRVLIETAQKTEYLTCDTSGLHRSRAFDIGFVNIICNFEC